MRDCFPFFKKKPTVIYLDSAATSQMLYTVIEDEIDFMTSQRANAHRSGHSMGAFVDNKYNLAKETIGDWLNISDPLKSIVFTSGASQGLSDVANVIQSSFGGGTIFVGIDFHHSAYLPFMRMCERNPEWSIELIDIDYSHGTLDLAQLENKLASSWSGTKVVVATAVSNVIGRVGSLPQLSKVAKKYNAVTVLDASQLVSKRTFQPHDFDFVVWSWHKVYGPMGLGCLVLAPRWYNVEPTRPGGGSITSVKTDKVHWIDTAQRFESGTQNLQAIVTIPRLVEWLKQHSVDIEEHDKAVATHVMEYIEVYAPFFTPVAESNTSLVSVVPTVGTAEDFTMMLDAANVMTRAGKLCAQPLVDKLSDNTSMLRLSWAAYTTKEELRCTFDKMVDIHDRIARVV